MRSTPRRLLSLLLLSATAACGGAANDADTAAAPDSSEASVYGATGEDLVRVQLVEVTIDGLPAGLEGAKLATIGDFQLGLWAGNEKVAARAVQLALEQQPDAVVLLGDYLAGSKDYAALGRVFGPLRGRPAFAVLGTADEVESPEAPDTVRARIVQGLTNAGVRVLRNERARLVRNGDTAWIAGVEPYLARRPEWRVAEVLNGLPSSTVLLSHMPAVAARTSGDRFPAVLAAHTFCGRVEVPGTPRLSWLNTEVFPFAEGSNTQRIYRVRGATLFVTCGVGYSFLPVRFGAAPEVALVTLRGRGTPAGTVAADTAAPAALNVDSALAAARAAEGARRERARRDSLEDAQGRPAPEPARPDSGAAAQPDTTQTPR